LRNSGRWGVFLNDQSREPKSCQLAGKDQRSTKIKRGLERLRIAVGEKERGS